MSTEAKQITLALIGLYTVCYNEIIVIAIQPYSVCVCVCERERETHWLYCFIMCTGFKRQDFQLEEERKNK